MSVRGYLRAEPDVCPTCGRATDAPAAPAPDQPRPRAQHPTRAEQAMLEEVLRDQFAVLKERDGSEWRCLGVPNYFLPYRDDAWRVLLTDGPRLAVCDITLPNRVEMGRELLLDGGGL